ncbi:MAG: hypothetical protein H8D96_03440 [Desulfobacterales bacterium]|uniref:KAP NTPase domain-containing protein n=1 Tax=Candidatus Desulfatibia vada TaxID=2841696 RepID=A0A8J6NYM4_9BACT|nr:hypothetical protein [Candidatus Desulfatibia vada]
MRSVSEQESSKLNKDTLTNVRETEPEVCPTRLIDDTPADEDLLAFHDDIGPHERVARTIAELISSPEESGGKTIGLEGGWGAGKTTVIKMIEKQLSDNEDITVLSFDAWAHEGDPLRRTYLESLIQHFKSIGWVDKIEWNKTLDKLAKRRRVTTTRTIPKTTILGTLFVISAFLVPLGVPFLETSLSKGITFGSSRPISWSFVFGLLFTTAPFLVLIGNLVRTVFKRNVNKNAGESSDKSQDDGKEISDWAFITGNAITETKQDTTETPEPTSIEFEGDFRKLMREALPENSNKKAAIVLDNLDRVDPKDALSIWATLQTFLQDRNTRKEQWFDKLWIIVPYDPIGLRQLWDKRDTISETLDMKEEDPASGHEVDEPVMSDSFIDKSFQLRFEVPPPVLSNWKEYLKKLVSEALPTHPEEDRHTIYRVFNVCRAKDGEAPTPRELKLYVNQIGAIHRQWGDDFHIGHVAYYVILRRKQSNIRKGLLEGALPHSKIKSILPPNLEANLAGLTFNVQARLGQQLLLRDPINSALTENDAEGLQKLEKLHADAFLAVLEDEATSMLADSDAKIVVNAALCLDEIEVLKDQERNETSTIIRELGRAAVSLTSWAPIDESLYGGIVAVCKLVSDLEVSKKVVATLRQTIKELEATAVTDDNIAGLVFMSDQIDEIGHQDALDSPFTLPVDAQGWVEVCSHIRKYEEKRWPLFTPEVKFDEISELFCTSVTTGQFADAESKAVYVTQITPCSSKWNSLAIAIEQRLNASQNPNVKEVNRLLKELSLLLQYGCDNAVDVLKRLADGGHLMHLLHLAESENHIECKAWCIVTFLEHQPGAAATPEVGNSAAGHANLTNLLKTDDAVLAETMVDKLSAHGNLNLLLSIVDERNNYDPLVLRCLRIVVDQEMYENFITPLVIIERWPDLWEYLDEDEADNRFDKVIGFLCEKSSLIKEVQEKEDGFDYENVGLYFAICKASSSGSFREWCRAGLENLDVNTWLNELKKGGLALELMLTLMESGISVALKQPYQDALVQHAKGVLNGSVKLSNDLISQRSKVIDGLGADAARTILRSRLCQAAIDQDGKCADGFFEMYGDEIADDATLTENSNTVAKLFSPLVRERALGGLRWIRGVINNNPEFLEKHAGTASVQDFRERLQGELGKTSEEDGETHNLIEEIASILGIEPVEKPPEDEADTEDSMSEDNGSEEENSSEE